MVEKLKDKVSADGSFTLRKVLKAGSNAKFTSLRRTAENVFDVDLGAYYQASSIAVQAITGAVTVLGNTYTAASQVFVRNGVIEGEAPALTTLTIFQT